MLFCDWLPLCDRSLLLAELEKEEKEKDWYYAQLQNLTKRIDSLPLTENVSSDSMHCDVHPGSLRCCGGALTSLYAVHSADGHKTPSAGG